MTVNAGRKVRGSEDLPGGKAHHDKDKCSAGEFYPSSHCGDDGTGQAKINVLKRKGLGERCNLRMRAEEHGRCQVSTACKLDRLRSFGIVEDERSLRMTISS